MKQYIELLSDIIEHGESRNDRTGTGTISVFGRQMRFNLSEGFPLLTTKKLHFKSILYELLWFLRGDTNIDFLIDNGVTIWNEWADPFGRVGRIYGAQWTKWRGYDGTIVNQIEEAERLLREDPYSRRIVVTAWNPAEIDSMALPPCHVLFQLYRHSNSRKLDLHLYQRSADVFLGLPFNIASYALLLSMFAVSANLQPSELVISLGDVHLYKNHVEQARMQLQREPRKLPGLCINLNRSSVFQYGFSDFNLTGYDPHPHIKADVSV